MLDKESLDRISDSVAYTERFTRGSRGNRRSRPVPQRTFEKRWFSGTTKTPVGKTDATFVVTGIRATDGRVDPVDDAEWTVNNPGFCIDQGATCYIETDSTVTPPDGQDAGLRVYDAPCGSSCS